MEHLITISVNSREAGVLSGVGGTAIGRWDGSLTGRSDQQRVGWLVGWLVLAIVGKIQGGEGGGVSRDIENSRAKVVRPRRTGKTVQRPLLPPPLPVPLLCYSGQ